MKVRGKGRIEGRFEKVLRLVREAQKKEYPVRIFPSFVVRGGA